MDTKRKPGDPFPTSYHGDVLFVEYRQHGRRWHPFSIITTKGRYDAEWSRRCGDVLVHRSGSGSEPNGSETLCRFTNPEPPVRFWACSTFQLRREVKHGKDWTSEPASERQIRAMGYARLAKILGDPFEDARGCEDIVYCSVCDDRMPDDYTCRHVFWSGTGRDGPGSDEGPYEATKDAFLRFVRATGILRGVRRGLVPFALRGSQLHATGGLGPSFVHVYSQGKDLGDVARRVDGRPYLRTHGMRDGISWLFSIDEKTTKANALTKGWLDEEVTKQSARRVSSEAVYVVRSQYWYGGYVTDEAHADFSDNGESPYRYAPSPKPTQKHGAWWTHYSGRNFATRMCWADALKLRNAVRKAGGYDAAIVYCPAPAARTAAA